MNSYNFLSFVTALLENDPWKIETSCSIKHLAVKIVFIWIRVLTSCLGMTSKKSKKWDFVPLSVDPYPPTKIREVLIRDTFDVFLPPTLLIEKGTFLKKIGLPSTFIVISKGIKIGVKIIFHPFHLNLLSRGHNNAKKM